MNVAWDQEIQNAITEEVIAGIEMKVYRDRPKTLIETFENSVARFPDRVALVHDNDRITYRNLQEQVQSMAYQLRNCYGVEKGDRVALLLMNGIPFVVGVFAVLQIGAIAVPLNTKLRTSELEYMLQNSGAKVIITNLEWWPNLSPIIGTIPVEHVFVTSDTPPNGTLAYKLLTQETAPGCVREEVNEHDAAIIMYTSGTTGRPKGAVITHFNLIHSAINYALCFNLSSDDKTLVAVPLFHITGFAAQLVPFIYLGGKIVLMPMFKADQFLQLIQEESITHVIAAPTVYVMSLMQPDYTQYDTSSFRCAAFGGAPMPAETVKALQKWIPGLELHNAYGLTETASPVTLMPHQHQVRKLNTVGIPVPVGEVKVADPATREELPPGQVGELLVKGPMVVPGYWQNEAATKLAIVDGWFATGDLAMIDEEGFVSIMDRIKDMINRGGEKVYSAEVEDVLYSNTKIMEAAIVGVPDSTYGEVVKAYVVPRQGQRLSEEEVKQWVAERMAKYKVPAYVEFLEALPRNPNGKIIKTQLRYVNSQ
ncbi:class I adenylate-forming enzyme family protein [Aneurinibacillus sp. Ricciae_BoGa-3]|uniref:class I adenylate-forming enzyme family protein n=1 Tax=Aneurinibacillus sp. Ricciae_BoGa-3 TaxID=3022697 RepID=UPI00234082E5|nr:class I adenylate-forming enzyme family protein [Aneurinibacillus sp. Ricciae_BoGa-3]WCK56044.1 class I adenylate-forming enzyme family protein [Aneurinibacillus sp. Ricciae_BoGa-3]